MRVNNNTATTSTAWPPQVPPPTLSERRGMKKAAQPEHSYTGYIPKWLQETEEPAAAAGPAPQRQRNTPILGYSGHLRHEEDRIGTTFSKGLEIARQPVAAPAGPLTQTTTTHNNQAHAEEDSKKRVSFRERADRVNKNAHTRLTHHARPPAHEPFSKPENLYGDYAAKPFSDRSGYGAFDGASGYGEFAAPPGRSRQANASAASGYGAFDGASGYGEFQAKPMSARSGYGAFDGASGYGEFHAKPMSARSGYGAFDGASGYGEFHVKPMSARSGYGEFDGASGYGDFHGRPEHADDVESRPGSADSQEYGAFGASVEYGDFLAPASGYGAFDGASGYGEFMAAPSLKDRKVTTPAKQPATQQPHSSVKQALIVKVNEELDRKYQRAMRAVGGEANVSKLLDAFASTIAQRHHKRTELLQAIKRSFEKHEHENQGRMPKAHLKEALQGLACVFTDDQIMALMAVYDPECRGFVPMDAVLTDLTRRVVA